MKGNDEFTMLLKFVFLTSIPWARSKENKVNYIIVCYNFSTAGSNNSLNWFE